MLSFYPIVRTAPVTRTRYIDPLTAASPVLITVPPFAKRLWVWRQSPKTVALTLFFFGPATAGGYEYFLPVDAGNGFNGYMIEPIIVAPDVAQIQVTKTAGPDSSVRCVFELGI